jgi:hypothetical protein
VSNEISVYQNIADPVAAVTTIGKAITASRIFGCQNEAQGQILALECLAKRLPPLALAEQYHLIDGKLSMKADAMLAGFEDLGGEYEVKEYSPDACEVIFRRGKNTLPIRITWEMAQQEKWPFAGGNKLKTNWSTPIGRQDMLWARVVSRGVRKLAPGVVCGRYTPEEISDFESPPAAPVLAIEKAKALAASSAPAKPEVIIDAEVIEPTIDDGEPASLEGKVTAYTNEPCTIEEVNAIKAAASEAKQTGVLDIADRITKKLASLGKSKLSELSSHEASLFLNAIQKRNLETFFDLNLAGSASFDDSDIPF